MLRYREKELRDGETQLNNRFLRGSVHVTLLYMFPRFFGGFIEASDDLNFADMPYSFVSCSLLLLLMSQSSSHRSCSA